MNICVLGGTGFVGSNLVTHLANLGHTVRVPTRRRERHRKLLVLPSVSLLDADIHDIQQLKSLFRDCHVVINLVGILNEKGRSGKGFRHVHVELTRKVLEACGDNSVPRLLHMSALNASQDGGSYYLRTKGEAENMAHMHSAHGLKVTSFRPSVIFGEGDSFLNRFAGLLKLSPGIFPLACPNARFAPVYVDDVVQAFCDAIDDKSTYGKRIDLCGPNTYSLRELVEYTARISNHKRLILGLPKGLSYAQALILEYMPGKPFSVDNYHSLQTDSICREASLCTTSLESRAPLYLGSAHTGRKSSPYRTHR